jgi:hypothetical protein
VADTDDQQDALRGYLGALDRGTPPARERGARRRRLVPLLREHVTREHRRVRVRRLWVRGATVVVTAGAAAAMALVFGSARLQVGGRAGAPTIALLEGTVLFQDAGGQRTLGAGATMAIGASESFEAPRDGTAALRLAGSATLTLQPAARVSRVVAGAPGADGAPRIEAVTLERGRAHLRVTKLAGPQRFHVLTADADVQVRGTEFDVELAPGATPHTCVRVQEGLVAVVTARGQSLVAAGQTWGCDVPSPAAAASGPAAASIGAPLGADATPPARTPTPRALAPRAEPQPSPSDLARQNALFQSALQAERAGRHGEATRLYQTLLARAPRGPLAAQARANLAAVSRPR